MFDLWFVLGVALGTIVTGFCAVGSSARGYDSARRREWSVELAARKRAVVASRSAVRSADRPDVTGALRRAS